MFVSLHVTIQAVIVKIKNNCNIITWSNNIVNFNDFNSYYVAKLYLTLLG